MRRTHQALITLALGLVLATATTAAWATPATGTQDQADQRRPLDQPQQERTLARHRALGAIAEGELLAGRTTLYQPQPDRYLQQRAQAGSEQERALARHRALLARHRALGAIAALPAPRTDRPHPAPARTCSPPCWSAWSGAWSGVLRPCSAGPPPPADAGPRRSSAAEPPSPTGRP